MTSTIYTVAKGNTTLIVKDCERSQRAQIIADNLRVTDTYSQIEQIGFVNSLLEKPSFAMMGGEFSVNGTLAFSSTLAPYTEFYVSGLSSPILSSRFQGLPTIAFEMPYTKEDSLVTFEGIGYKLFDSEDQISTLVLSSLCTTYNLPAFGGLIYENDILYPFVYVRDTHSLIKETACGSGSIALSLLMNLSSVTQPTGGTIYINRRDTLFTISAEVDQIN